MTVVVQIDTLDESALLQRLRQSQPQAGAIVSFLGQVRSLNEGEVIQTLTLEHYPGMTEKSLARLEEQARARWDLLAVEIHHRVGALGVGEAIVFVAVASHHRQQAFAACEFLMDQLKTTAPFWKKETTAQGTRWVAAKTSDEQARRRWEPNAGPEGPEEL